MSTDLEAPQTALTGYYYRMSGSAADSEDDVQETLIRARLVPGGVSQPGRRRGLRRVMV